MVLAVIIALSAVGINLSALCGIFRRGRRSHRYRPAENRRQFHLGIILAGG